MPEVYQDDDVTIELLSSLGSYENNSYIVCPVGGGSAVVVDVPEGFEAVLEALGEECGRVTHVVMTHSHLDHWAGYDEMRSQISAPVYAGEKEAKIDESRNVRRLADGDEIAIGNGTIRVLHTPGHTPGSISLLVGRAVITGDTLFPGGPGHSRSNETLQQAIASIISKLHSLPDETLVLPGHGGSTTIGESKAEYAVFASKEHLSDLHGDVLWLES